MSKGIRRPSMKAPFEAKHVIVAGCAAVAMVLGAMSVGTSFIRSSDSSATGEVSAIINSDTPRQRKPASVTDFSRQHTMEVRDFLQQDSSPYTAPKTSKNNRKAVSPVFSSISPFFLSPITQLPLSNATPSDSTVDDDKGTAASEADPAKSSGNDAPTSSEDAATPPSDTSTGDSGSTDSTTNEEPTTMRSQTVEPAPAE